MEDGSSALEAMDLNFWRDKKIFLTGHTGFKGSWMTLWLQQLGADVSGYALAPGSEPSLFNEAKIAGICRSTIGDLANQEKLTAALKESKAAIVFHFAAQPLVRPSYADPKGTYQTNVMGTLNLLEAVRASTHVKTVVVITTDKVYENFERESGYKENDPLGGYDPYSSSKACAEILTSSYARSFLSASGVGVATARAGNVIGGGDWALDRLIPDAVRAWYSKKDFVVRNPSATRPWQHVLEPLSGYLNLAEKLHLAPKKFNRAFNFGPLRSDQTAVINVVEKIRLHFGPDFSWKVEKAKLHEVQNLSLNIELAKSELAWIPKWNLDQAIQHTLSWYKSHHSGSSAAELCAHQIKEFQK